MKMLTFLTILCFYQCAFSQCPLCTSSETCEHNVNEPSWAADYYDVKQATFKFETYEGTCTGVLLNQKVNQDQMQNYFLTCWHCIPYLSGTQMKFYFNFQSPDDDNCSVPISNHGCVSKQSGSIDPQSGLVTDGYEYYLESTITVIDHWMIPHGLGLPLEDGDLALCRIDAQIPPNFNVYYAGWLPHTHTYNYELFDLFYGPFIGIHHPNADIKKASKINLLFPNDNLMATGCTIVTTIVNWIGNLFGQNWSTQVICDYIEVPNYTTPVITHGTFEHGSSGSPLVTNGGKVIGCLRSHVFSGCDLTDDAQFPKFKNFYRSGAVHGALNPSNNIDVDLFGITSRQRTCYDQLDLKGQWFPLSHYQSDNHLELHANNDINIVGELHVHNGSDYTLSAGGDINGGTNLSVDNVNDVTFLPGSSNGNCQPDAYRNIHESNPIAEIIASFPKIKKFDIAEHQKISFVKVFPNPTTDLLNITVLSDKNYSIEIYDMMGKKMFSEDLKCDRILLAHKNTIDVASYASGFYLIKVVTVNGKAWSDKIIKL